VREIWFRSVDRRYPFLWGTDARHPARWHGRDEGPAQYLADTPDGAWAEFLRHEEISDGADLSGITRVVWAIELDLEEEEIGTPQVDERTLLGGYESYPRCQEEALRLRAGGATGLITPSAALEAGGARGQCCVGDALLEADSRDGRTLTLFGIRPRMRGWITAEDGRPGDRVLSLVRPLAR